MLKWEYMAKKRHLCGYLLGPKTRHFGDLFLLFCSCFIAMTKFLNIHKNMGCVCFFFMRGLFHFYLLKAGLGCSSPPGTQPSKGWGQLFPEAPFPPFYCSWKNRNCLFNFPPWTPEVSWPWWTPTNLKITEYSTDVESVMVAFSCSKSSSLNFSSSRGTSFNRLYSCFKSSRWKCSLRSCSSSGETPLDRCRCACAWPVSTSHPSAALLRPHSAASWLWPIYLWQSAAHFPPSLNPCAWPWFFDFFFSFFPQSCVLYLFASLFLKMPADVSWCKLKKWLFIIKAVWSLINISLSNCVFGLHLVRY